MSVMYQSSQFESRIAQARVQFRERAETRLNELLATVAGDTPNMANESRARTIHRMVHDLVGSAAMIGLPDVAAQMRPVCDRLAVADETGENICASLTTDIKKAVENARFILSVNPE